MTAPSRWGPCMTKVKTNGLLFKHMGPLFKNASNLGGVILDFYFRWDLYVSDDGTFALGTLHDECEKPRGCYFRQIFWVYIL